MQLTIEPTDDPDIPARLNEVVHRLHYTSHPEVFQPYDYEAFRPWFVVQLAKPTTTCLSAFLDDEPVGYALFFLREPSSPFLQPSYRSVQLDQLAVLPEYQGRGIGGLLLDRVEQFCREKNVDRLQLSVWITNFSAREFYRKRGFEPYLEHWERKLKR